MPDPGSPVTSKNGRRPIVLAFALSLSAFAAPVLPAEITGRVVDDQGRALAYVPICLKHSGEGQDCLEIQFTDKKGDYRFRGRKLARKLIVEVHSDNRAATRRFNRFGNYSWVPTHQQAALTRRGEEIALAPFVGSFDFRNFQPTLLLTAEDFPELSEFDLAGDYVVLKVSHAPDRALQPPNTVFLGRVTDASRIRLQASLPASVAVVDYEIYSAQHRVSGRIDLVDEEPARVRKLTDLRARMRSGEQ